MFHQYYQNYRHCDCPSTIFNLTTTLCKLLNINITVTSQIATTLEITTITGIINHRNTTPSSSPPSL
jgi:hypothetical protein